MHNMNDLFGSVRSVQRYYNHSGTFQMDYSIRDKLAFSPEVVVSLTLTDTQKMTQERTLKMAGSGAMFEPIVLVKASSVVRGLHSQ